MICSKMWSAITGKSLTFVAKLSERSLIEIKNSNGPSIDPWGTSSLMLTHEEYCPFKRTLISKIKKIGDNMKEFYWS